MVPTIEKMIADGQRCAARIKRSSEAALQSWFAQSERLQIARDHYQLKGAKFIDFAAAIGVDRSSAFELVKLIDYRVAIEQECKLREVYPGWLTCLHWFAPRRPLPRNSPAQQRIAELEAALTDLQQENDALRRQLAEERAAYRFVYAVAG